MKNLSRNVPVALVVGAAGFIGSHLVDKLLEKGIQVVGVDDLSDGSMENLSDAAKNSRFHLIKTVAENKIDFNFPKLNYAFFVISENISSSRYLAAWDNFLSICKDTKCKIVLVSSIRLYNPHEDRLDNLRKAEKVLADFTATNNLNARIVRLSTVFGPRTHFRENDPVITLLKAAASGNLQTETTALDFTTRAVYISDAVDLLVKALMHGSTSQKIYDGALPVPVKVAEIKQVLLDPVWHEERGFMPTELPPWPSPNLLKTIKELSWHPSSNIVQALKKTTIFFKGRKDLLVDKTPSGHKEDESDKVKEMRAFLKGKEGESEKKENDSGQARMTEKGEDKIVIDVRKIGRKARRYSFIIVGLALIIYAFIYPISNLVFSLYSYKTHMQSSLDEISKGDFKKAKVEIAKAQIDARAMGEIVGPLSLVGNIKPLEAGVSRINLLAKILQENTDALESSIKAGSLFEEGIKAISGEVSGQPQQYFEAAVAELDKAERTLSYTDSNLASSGIPGFIPSQIRDEIDAIRVKNDKYRKVIDFSKSVSSIFPQAVSSDGRKTYLILLEDNTILRPGGGVISAYGEMTFDKGKLVNIRTGNIDTLDQKFTENLKPPADVAGDLKMSRWTLQNSNTDSDFPTSASLAQWFYQKEAGVGVSGVIMMDLTSVQQMLAANGQITLATSGEKITSSNLLEKVKSAGNRKEFLNALLNSYLNKSFYVTRQNWPESISALQSTLTQKHLMFYFSDPTLLAYIVSNNWSGLFPKQTGIEAGKKDEFLSIYESDLDGNIPNYYLDRKVNLESKIDKDGNVKHQLEVSFKGNQQLGSDAGGRLRKRIKLYFAAGSKLTSAKLEGIDVTKSVSAFSDYGRAGYSLIFDVKAGSPTTLIFDYQDLSQLSFVNSEAKYKVDIFKQPGAGDTQFDYKVTYPEGWTAESKDFQAGGHALNYSTNFNKDLSLEATLKRQVKL